MTDHDHLRARLGAATPGPWVSCDDGGSPRLRAVVHVDPEGREVIVACGFYQADADLIVAARTELPGLLDEIERLKTALLCARREIRLRDLGYEPIDDEQQAENLALAEMDDTDADRRGG